MQDEIQGKLSEEIEKCIEDLTNLQLGSDEYDKAVKNLATLHELKMDEIKITNDSKIREREMTLKSLESNERLKDRYIRLGVDVAGIVLPLVFYASWMRKGFKFEETGTFTSTTFRGLFQKFKTTGK